MKIHLIPMWNQITPLCHVIDQLTVTRGPGMTPFSHDEIQMILTSPYLTIRGFQVGYNMRRPFRTEEAI